MAQMLRICFKSICSMDKSILGFPLGRRVDASKTDEGAGPGGGAIASSVRISLLRVALH